MSRNVNGKIIAITGGAEGLGLAMVKSFLQRGAKMAIILDINEQLGNKNTVELNMTYPNKVAFYKCNVVSDLNKVFDVVIQNHQKIDVLVNNAGVLDEDNIKRTMDINIHAVMEWTMKFYEHMRIDKGGSGGTIINISSIFGYRITPYMPYYQAAKFAVLGFSKSLGHEFNFELTGVRILTLCPGLVFTTLTKQPEIREKNMMAQFKQDLENYEWQNTDAIGEGAVEIFEKADSGTAWVVEGSRTSELVN